MRCSSEIPFQSRFWPFGQWKDEVRLGRAARYGAFDVYLLASLLAPHRRMALAGVAADSPDGTSHETHRQSLPDTETPPAVQAGFCSVFGRRRRRAGGRGASTRRSTA